MRRSSALEKSFVAKKPLYKPPEAIAEAERCLYCYDAPCIAACPTDINVPRFIRSIAEQQPLKAARIILQDNILGYSCARVCPVEVLCEGSCVLHHKNESPIAIGKLQHFATDQALRRPLVEILGPKGRATNKRVACIGAGSASIALAALLSHKGHHVEIFEKSDLFGGLNAWGIAPYKLMYDDALAELNWLKTLGIIIHEKQGLVLDNSVTGVDASFLLAHFDAIYLGLGIGEDNFFDGLPEHERIVGAVDLICRLKTDHNFSLQGIHRAHVIGGGNTAIDVAHELSLLGMPEVTLVYRKERGDMSAYQHEVKDALHNGVRILENTVLREVSTAGLNAPLILSFQRIDHELIRCESDLLVFAIGQKKDLALTQQFEGLELSSGGTIKVNEKTFQTGHQKVWAGGDAVNGGKEVVNAVFEAKMAAASIHAYLMNENGEDLHA